MNEITTITTATGTTYVIVNNEDITRVAALDAPLRNPEGFAISTQIDCADWWAIGEPTIGRSLVGTADGVRLVTSPITAITVEFAS